MEFSIAGHPGDFFPVSVSFSSTKSYCDLKVCVTETRLFLGLVNQNTRIVGWAGVSCWKMNIDW